MIKILVFGFAGALVVCAFLFLYVEHLKDVNQELEASNNELAEVLKVKAEEALKQNKELELLSTKLKALKAKSIKGEDQLNEALYREKCARVTVGDDVLNKLRD